MIFRTIKNKENPYTIIPNSIIDNPNLSWKAKGIFAYLLSNSNEKEIKLEDIIKHAKNGKESVRSGIKELQEKGIISIDRGGFIK